MTQTDSSSHPAGASRPTPRAFRLLDLCRQRYAEAVERCLRASLGVWQAQGLFPATVADVLERRFALMLDRRVGAALEGGADDALLDGARRLIEANEVAAEAARHPSWIDLDLRLRTLLHDPDWERIANPLAPERAIAALLEAAQAMGIAPGPRLTLAGRWAGELVPALARTYGELAAYLAQKGVTPCKARAAAEDPDGDSAAIEVWDPLASSHGDALAAMQCLLEAAQAKAGFDAPATMERAPGAFDVIAWLSALQRTEAAAMVGRGAAGATWLPADRGLIPALKALPVYPQLGHVERVMIDMVGRMFEYILGSAIPDRVKPHMSRLQIPVLKAALLDPSFCGNRAHPARALLDLIAEAAIGWDAESEAFEDFVRTVGELVQRVLVEFDRDLAVFERVAQDFQAFVGVYERAAGAAVAHTAAALAQREEAEARAEAARRAAEEAVGMRVADPELPDSVRLFLCQQWVKPLARAYLEDGPESRSWLDLIGIMDDLIWSVQPKLSAESRQYLVKILPGLLRRLQAAMNAAEILQAVRDEFMGRLVICHAQAVKAGYQAAEPQPVPEESWRALALARIAQTRMTPSVVLPFRRTEAAAEDLSRLTLQFIHLEAVGPNGSSEEIALPDEARGVAPPQESMPEDADVLAGLQPGMWVSFRRRGGTPYEARLKWISPMRRTYLFTDREGRRVATVSAAHLAAALRLGGATQMEDRPLTERAVDSVIESLKRQAAA